MSALGIMYFIHDVSEKITSVFILPFNFVINQMPSHNVISSIVVIVEDFYIPPLYIELKNLVEQNPRTDNEGINFKLEC